MSTEQREVQVPEGVRLERIPVESGDIFLARTDREWRDRDRSMAMTVLSDIFADHGATVVWCGDRDLEMLAADRQLLARLGLQRVDGDIEAPEHVEAALRGAMQAALDVYLEEAGDERLGIEFRGLGDGNEDRRVKALLKDQLPTLAELFSQPWVLELIERFASEAAVELYRRSEGA